MLLFPRQFWPKDADMFGRIAETTAERGDFFLFYSYADLAGEPAALADIVTTAMTAQMQLLPMYIPSPSRGSEQLSGSTTLLQSRLRSAAVGRHRQCILEYRACRPLWGAAQQH